MKLLFTPVALEDLENQIEYGRRRFGDNVANRTLKRTKSYIEDVLLRFPRIGVYDPAIEAFETWIPDTPFVVYYKIREPGNELVIVAVFHHAQDRSSFDPGGEED